MRVNTVKSFYRLPVIAVVAMLLFGTPGVARIMGWMPGSTNDFGAMLVIEPLTAASAKRVSAQVDSTPSEVAGNVPTQRRCAVCGVIAAIRKIEVSGKEKEMGVEPAISYEFIVRLDDGSQRVMTDANRSTWRLGDSVDISDGSIPANS